jgi:hypothetical protein
MEIAFCLQSLGLYRVLLSYFTEEIHSNILPKLKIVISSTRLRNSTFRLRSTRDRTEFLTLVEDIPDLQY